MLSCIHQRSERKLHDKVLYEQHLERMKSMLPAIDNNEPRKHPFNHRRLRELIAQTRKIEKENIQILQNIAIAIQKPTIDNTLSNHVQNVRNFKKQLYRLKRKNELQTITDENLKLLTRIQTVPPTIHIS
jgi:hypothetical protein